MEHALNRIRQHGFSLIELMVAVAIVGILAAVAIPSYSRYVVRSNRSAAQTHLMEIAQRQSQYFVDNRAYVNAPDGDLTALGLTTPAKVASQYKITVPAVAGPPSSFTATATPISSGPQANDDVLSINNAGTKTPSDKW